MFGWLCFVFVCLICLAHRSEKAFFRECCLYLGLLKPTIAKKSLLYKRSLSPSLSLYPALSHILFVGLCKYLFSLTVLPDLDCELSSAD